MANTRRSGEGTEEPEQTVATSTAPTTVKPKARGRKTSKRQAGESADDGRDQSGMPGGFPTYPETAEDDTPTTNEHDKRAVEDQLEGERIVPSRNAKPCPPGVSIAASVACPPLASIAASAACPTASIAGNTACPTACIAVNSACPTASIVRSAACPTASIDRSTACPTFPPIIARRLNGDETSDSDRSTLSLDVDQEGTTATRVGGVGLYITPKKRAHAKSGRNRTELNGPKVFPISFDNITTNDRVTLNETDERESRSDETPRLGAQVRMSTKSKERQQRAEDLAFLQSVIDDRARRSRLRALLPEIKTNNKTLSAEIQEVLETSGEEYDTFAWADSDKEMPHESSARPSKSNTNGTVTGLTYFDKGKWVRDEDYEAQQAYRQMRNKAQAQVNPTKPQKPAEGRKKPRMSIGIAIDDVRTQATREISRSNAKINLDASVASLPAGGYFAQKMRSQSEAPEPVRAKRSKKSRKKAKNESTSESSSDSSSDSSSGSSYRQRKREKYRKKAKELKRLQRAGIKTKLPTPYQGQENYDEFELWDFEIDQWLADTGYRGTEAVRRIGTFLTDKASSWYMDYVAPDQSAYTVNTLKISLFNYCFPPDFKAKLRREFRNTRQNEKKFADFLRELKRFQRRLTDITDRQICLKLWESVNIYIKIKWAENGFDAEDSSLEELSRAAERFENAETIRQRLTPKGSLYGQFNGDRQANDNTSEEESQETSDNQETDNESSTHSERLYYTSSKPRAKGDRSTKLSSTERDELRAAGRCLSCKQSSHIARNCPNLDTAKATDLYSSALQFREIERLRKARDESYLSVASIRYDDNSEKLNSILEEIEQDAIAFKLTTGITETEKRNNFLPRPQPPPHSDSPVAHPLPSPTPSFPLKHSRRSRYPPTVSKTNPTTPSCKPPAKQTRPSNQFEPPKLTPRRSSGPPGSAPNHPKSPHTQSYPLKMCQPLSTHKPSLCKFHKPSRIKTRKTSNIPTQNPPVPILGISSQAPPVPSDNHPAPPSPIVNPPDLAAYIQVDEEIDYHTDPELLF